LVSLQSQINRIYLAKRMIMMATVSAKVSFDRVWNTKSLPSIKKAFDVLRDINEICEMVKVDLADQMPDLDDVCFGVTKQAPSHHVN
jgi:hypothetical protein